MTAAWRPKQIPKSGFIFSLHQRHAAILPSIPRLPNPPGTITPLIKYNKSITFNSVKPDNFTKFGNFIGTTKLSVVTNNLLSSDPGNINDLIWPISLTILI